MLYIADSVGSLLASFELTLSFSCTKHTTSFVPEKRTFLTFNHTYAGTDSQFRCSPVVGNLGEEHLFYFGIVAKVRF